MKKFITLAGAAALLLGSAAPALAGYRHHHMPMPSYDVTNKANVVTILTVKADTGDNAQKVYGTGTNEMGTGAAYAEGLVSTFANQFDGCGCLKGDLVNDANVMTDANVKADTGDNYQKVMGGMQMPVKEFGRHHHQAPTGSNTLWTGAAGASGNVFTVVNAAWMPL